MLSLRRLGYVLLIVLGICGIFILYNLNEKNNQTVSITNNHVEKRELLHADEVIDNEAGIHFYVIGTDKKDIYKNIYNNVCQTMEDLKVPWCTLEKVEE